jgi:hypothetical protein
MHGLVMAQLASFLKDRLGEKSWRELRRDTGASERAYQSRQSYPDSEMTGLVDGAVAVSGRVAPDLLRDFGAFLAPTLLRVFKAYVQPGWRTLEVIAHTETAMHKAVRQRDPTATPPHLQATRTAPDRVTVVYRSSRRLCALAEGICLGIARHFEERIEITQTTCMHRGDPVCTLEIHLLE